MKVSRSDLILYTIAFISAIAVVVLVYAYIEKRIADAEAHLPVKTIKIVEKPELAPVLVATRDLFRGEKIEQEDVQVLMIAKEGIKLKGVYSKPEEAVGQVVKSDLYAGEWLAGRKFADKLAPEKVLSEGIKGLVAPGKRAMRIPVNPESGLMGILSPGDHVDVVSVFSSANGERTISRVILQNIEVLSIGQASHFKPKSDMQKVEDSGTKQDETLAKKSMVALHVDIQQAEELALAMSVGSVHLLLRNQTDVNVSDSDGVNVQVIESMKQKKVAHPAKNKRHTVELLQGGEVEEVTVQ